MKKNDWYVKDVVKNLDDIKKNGYPITHKKTFEAYGAMLQKPASLRPERPKAFWFGLNKGVRNRPDTNQPRQRESEPLKRAKRN